MNDQMHQDLAEDIEQDVCEPVLPDIDALEQSLGAVRGKGGRYVLVIGDDGALLCRMSGARLMESWFCPQDRLEQGQNLFAQVLRARQSAPLLVLADVLEQMYREDTLPKVGPLDQAKLLRRRLDMAFPGDSLKGALPLGSDAKGGEKVLMAALAESRSLNVWAGFLKDVRNPVTGYCLLPLECVGLLDRLMPDHGGEEGEAASEKSPSGKGKARHWRALIGLQSTGGLRQIFTVDGRMVITRLTQAPPMSETAALTLTIERELRSSLSYLKRLGYSEREPLDLTVIGDEAFCLEIGSHDLPGTSLMALTPVLAADMAGLKGAAIDNGGFSDRLMVEWAASRKLPILELPSKLLAERKRLRRATRLGAWATGLTTLAVGLFVGWLAYSGVQADQESATLSNRLIELSQGKSGSGKVEALPLPLADMRVAAAMGDGWSKARLDVAALLAALPADLAQRKVSFTTNPGGDKAAASKLPPARWELAVSYDLGGHTPLDEQVARIRDLKTRLSAAYPDCRVLVSRLPLGLQPGQVLSGNLGPSANAVERDAQLIVLVRKEGK